MQNIPVIDGTVNRVNDIFAATEVKFDLIFPECQDIAFIDEAYQLSHAEELDAAFNRIWSRRVEKRDAMRIHGLLFFELEHKKVNYPTRREEEAFNPNGTRLRS